MIGKHSKHSKHSKKARTYGCLVSISKLTEDVVEGTVVYATYSLCYSYLVDGVEYFCSVTRKSTKTALPVLGMVQCIEYDKAVPSMSCVIPIKVG